MAAFPKFRPDLILCAEENQDGKSRVVLKDPVGEKFFRLSRYEFRFLQRLDGGVSRRTLS